MVSPALVDLPVGHYAATRLCQLHFCKAGLLALLLGTELSQALAEQSATSERKPVRPRTTLLTSETSQS